MRITNRHKLPQPFVDAILNDDYSRGRADFSVTELIKPPQSRAVIKRMWDHPDMQEDVIDCLDRLDGKTGHAILEDAAWGRLKKDLWDAFRAYADLTLPRPGTPVTTSEIEARRRGFASFIDGIVGGYATKRNAQQYRVEERLFAEFQGIKPGAYGEKVILSGARDLYLLNNRIQDYKRCKTYAWILGEKEEWQLQLSMLNLLHVRNGGEPCDGADIIAWFKDWVWYKKGQGDYPDIPVKKMTPKLLSLEATEDYILERIAVHQAAEAAPLDAMPRCTDQERWARPTMYKVKKAGGKRALSGGVKATYEDAAEMLDTLPKNHWIDIQPGESIRCERFCLAKKWCHQYAEMSKDKVVV